MKSTIISLSTQ